MSPQPDAGASEPLVSRTAQRHPWILTRDHVPAIGLITLLVGLGMWLLPEHAQPLVAKRWLGLPWEILGAGDISGPATALSVLIPLASLWLGTGGMAELRRSGVRPIVSSSVIGVVWGIVTCVPLLALGGLLGGPMLAGDGEGGLGNPVLRAAEAGLFEEVLFRGVVVLGIWSIVAVNAPRQGERAKWAAIGLGAVLFAWVHPGSTEGAALVMYLVSGIWLGWVLTRGGLLGCVIAHGLYDLCVLVL